MHVPEQGPMQLQHAPSDDDLFEVLRDSDATTYVLSRDLELMRTNAGWVRFARANGGEHILAEWRPGRRILDAISEVVRPFFSAGYHRALRTGEKWEHDYECSSAIEHRRFRMIAFPTERGLVVTHALIIAEPHDREAEPPSEDYVASGMILMCAHCRRVRNFRQEARWDWVPVLVATMPWNVSYGLCPPCAKFYAAST